jgi:hypothetical protein
MATTQSPLSGVWAVTWRAVVYTPVGLAVFLFLLCIVVAAIFPPIIATECLFSGFWWQGVGLFVFWLLVLWAWRRFHLGNLFSDLA